MKLLFDFLAIFKVQNNLYTMKSKENFKNKMETWEKCNHKIIKGILEVISFFFICKNLFSNLLLARWLFYILCKHTVNVKI